MNKIINKLDELFIFIYVEYIKSKNKNKKRGVK